jgi:hypothetical protein
MDAQRYERKVQGLPRAYQKILEAVKAGAVTAPSLRRPTGRADGLTKELRKLCRMGLLREIGPDMQATTKGRKPMMYQVVPAGEVEEAREAYAVREAKGRRKRRAPQSRITDVRRQYEQGDVVELARTRRLVMQLTTEFGQVAKLAFWRCARWDDLDMLRRAFEEHREELADHLERFEQAEEALRLRALDDKDRDRLEKLERMDGRTDPESASYQAAADRLRAKLRRFDSAA